MGIVLLTSFSIAGVIVYHTPLDWDLSGEGFNHFVQTFKVPLGLAALLIPGIALLASNHRSVQTRAQIIAAESQNNFSNYYKHLEEFEKYAGKHLATSQGHSILRHVRETHKRLFPDAINGNLRVSPKLIATIERQVSDLLEVITRVEQQLDLEGWQKMLVDMDQKLSALEETIGITPYWDRSSSSRLQTKAGVIYSASGSYNSCFQSAYTRIHKVSAVFEFDVQTEIPNKLQLLRNIQIHDSPKAKIEETTPPRPFKILPFPVQT